MSSIYGEYCHEEISFSKWLSILSKAMSRLKTTHCQSEVSTRARADYRAQVEKDVCQMQAKEETRGRS